MTFKHVRTIPVLRSFDEQHARAFYVDFLGFEIMFEHRFAPHMPLFLGLSRNGVWLYVSEHAGDASAGAFVAIEIEGLSQFQAELAAKAVAAGYPAPQIRDYIGGGKSLVVPDHFGNRLEFVERD